MSLSQFHIIYANHVLGYIDNFWLTEKLWGQQVK